MRSLLVSALMGTLLTLGACSRQKPIVVGSKDTTEQTILAEIIAQQLEHRTDRQVKRQFGLGDTSIVYQLLLDGEIGLYPEYAELVVTDLLKEIPGGDSGVMMERARLELKRIARIDYVDPLGFDQRTTLAVLAAGHEGLVTASQAASSGVRWSIGVDQEIQSRSTGLPALKRYPFEMGAPLRAMKLSELFPAMDQNMVDLVATTASDGHFTSPKWKALEDDKNVFPSAPVALLVRDDILTGDSKVGEALNQLSGKISLEAMRKMNAAVQMDDRQVADVAAEFLKSAGLN